MKKKLVVILAALLLIVGAVWQLLPIPAVEADFQVQLVRVGTELENVTEQVDTEALSALLQGQTRSRFRRQFAPIQLTDTSVEITGMDSRGHWHFSLDADMQVVYDSAEKGGWPIQNGEALLTDVWDILNEK